MKPLSYRIPLARPFWIGGMIVLASMQHNLLLPFFLGGLAGVIVYVFNGRE
jgi:zinc transporter ZupT